MTERWRKSPNIIAVEADENYLIVIGGEPRRGARFAVDQETAQRLREGYICLNCFAVFESPFPENCTEPDEICNYHPRRQQPHDLEVMMKGTVLRSRAHDDDLMQAMDEMEEEGWTHDDSRVFITKTIPKSVPKDPRQAVKGLLIDKSRRSKR